MTCVSEKERGSKLTQTRQFAGSRFFVPFSLAEYPNILRWTRDCAARPAFQAAFKKGDPEILPMMPLGVESPTEADRPWTKAA